MTPETNHDVDIFIYYDYLEDQGIIVDREEEEEHQWTHESQYYDVQVSGLNVGFGLGFGLGSLVGGRIGGEKIGGFGNVTAVVGGEDGVGFGELSDRIGG